MPSTEQTYRSMKTLHSLFAVSAVILLIVTVWLFMNDHNKEWRDYQLTGRQRDSWALDAQHVQKTLQFAENQADLSDALRLAQSEIISPIAISEFKQFVHAETARLEAAGTTVNHADFTEIDRLEKLLAKQSSSLTKARVELAKATSAARAAIDKEPTPDPDGLTSLDEQLDKIKTEAAGVLKTYQTELEKTLEIEDTTIHSRSGLLAEFTKIVVEAKRREDKIVVSKKSALAQRTAITSELGIANNAHDTEKATSLQDEINTLNVKVKELVAQDAAANAYRKGLELKITEIRSNEIALDKQLSSITSQLERLHKAAYLNKTNMFEWALRQPISSAFSDGNIRIKQIWLPKLMINYNFSHVARFDRCISCHNSIAQTAPGTISDPAFPALSEKERNPTLTLNTPEETPLPSVNLAGETVSPDTTSVYGFKFAPHGQIDYYAATVQYVADGSLAAHAGLQVGDIITHINDTTVLTVEAARQQFLENVDWNGETTFELKIRRGLDHPYASHPRLDLYLTDSSPHDIQKFGCTICHDGQGSSTSFKWASHMPNNPNEAALWKEKYGWFDNHHWIFPQKANRFLESNCLKCHHEVVELEPNERFPEAPAPKLVGGYNLIRKYGCYGCHEINGFNGPDTRIGPDLRLEPNYHEVALSLLEDAGLSDKERKMAQTLVENWEDNSTTRHDLYNAIVKDANLKKSTATKGEVRLTKTSHQLNSMLKDVESPGRLRKAGPSLRYLKAKVDLDWLVDWIGQPSHFRPSSKMPQFFGLTSHLEDKDLAQTKAYEALEIRAIALLLLNNSRDFKYLETPKNVTEVASVQRGQWLFQSRGCLACHTHDAFPEINQSQGPNLSNIADKFKSNKAKGQQWLYSWIKQPELYHTRTVMPNLFLDPIEEKDAAGKPTGKITDPAADIVQYLTSLESDWKPKQKVAAQLTAEEAANLEKLTAEWLTGSFGGQSAKFAHEGIPAYAKVKGDEVILKLPLTDENRNALLLKFIGRRSVGKYGCFGCHDIPGFESAKPIGTALAEWGRKDASKLAFEGIEAFLVSHGLQEEATSKTGATTTSTEHTETGHDEAGHDKPHAHHLEIDSITDPDTAYYLNSLVSHQREGFIWQKIRQPRSYDYKRTENKGFNDRLRMPKFPFEAEDREKIITFVLGLVNEPPAESYIYKPAPRTAAMLAGRKVLEKFNCAGCHTMTMEKWKFAIDPDMLENPDDAIDFDFVASHIGAKELAASKKLDSRGMVQVLLDGMPVLSQETGKPVRVDEDGSEIEADDTESEPYYEFVLWKDQAINGVPNLIGQPNLMIPAKTTGYGPANGTAYPAWGGSLANYHYPHAIENEKKNNPAVNGTEAPGWLPPPLLNEGSKVQTDWLHAFLMNPTQIRPAVILRMPDFRMSSKDAQVLVDYFAAASNSDYPYEYKPSQQEKYLSQKENSYGKEYLDDAVKVVVDSNFCVKCHSVGDFFPEGAATGLGPDLAKAGDRLRPDYLKRWISNPKRILPYTGMPVNIPFDPEAEHQGGIAQELFHGTSHEQVEGITDFLLNYHVYTARQTKISSLIQAPAKEEAATKEPESDSASDSTPDTASDTANAKKAAADPEEKTAEKTDTKEEDEEKETKNTEDNSSGS